MTPQRLAEVRSKRVHMGRIPLTAFVCLAFLETWSAGCAAPGRQATEHAKIERVVREHVAERRIPGATVAVVQADDSVITLAVGTAVVEHGVPAKVETVYEIASITKQFTAAAILLLQAEGLLELDDPVNRHFENTPETWRGMTIRHLLTHTAGFPSDADEFASLTGRWPRYTTREVMEEAVRADVVTGRPGTRFDYGNVGYFVAARIIEEVSGISYRDFMQKRIFDALDMRHTLMHDELRVIPNEARGYGLKDGQLVGIWRDGMEEVAGGWGMYSTVPDLIRWDRAIRTGDLLPVEAWEEMFTPLKLGDGSRFRYGLGWWLPERNGLAYQYHSGVTGTEILRVPSHGLTVIVLTNLGQSNSIGDGEAMPWGLANRVACSLLPDFKPDRTPVPISTERLEDYVGRWEFDYGPAVISSQDETLIFADDFGEVALIHLGEDAFGNDGIEERLVFERDPVGRVIGARWVSETYQDECGRPAARSAREP